MKRAAAMRALRHALRAERPILLMYHRVETLGVDPWQLAVPPARFAEQISALMAARTVVPLSWLAAELAAGRFPRHTAAVTFDDGYADVFRNARPVLEGAGCPATVFITTDAIGSPAGFWWDILARVVLETPDLPSVIAFSLEGRTRSVAVDQPSRLDAVAAIHALLRPAPPSDRDAALAEIAAQAGAEAAPGACDLAMTAEEVAILAGTGLIEIGAHTLTHPAMASLSPDAQAHEVAASRRRCEDIVGMTVVGFAYPYGDYNAASISAARGAGLAYACTTVNRAVRRGEDRFALPRLLAADWDAATFRAGVLAYG